MILKKSIELNCNFNIAISAIKRSDLLRFVAHPLVTFNSLGDSLPYDWKEGTYWVNIHLFGLIPFPKQAIVISFPHTLASNEFVLKDSGYSKVVSKWDHTITIKKISESKILYIDHGEIEAGVSTPFIWLFALAFYTHRQRKWKNLCKYNFVPLDKQGSEKLNSLYANE